MGPTQSPDQLVNRQVAELNEQFGLGDTLKFERRPDSALIRAVMQDESGHRGEVYLHGAHVTRWTTPQGQELLFLSSQAKFDGSAIRGGIPIIFPQFGPGEMRSHGFARLSQWQVTSAGISAQGVELTMTLGSTPELRSQWRDNRFTAVLKVVLGPTLTTELQVENNQTRPFSFTTAFHTYYQVSDIANVSVAGLQGISYRDRLTGKELRECASVRFSEEVDRDYHLAPSTLLIIDTGANRSMTVKTAGMKDAVLWNPWIDKAKSMSDFGDEEYRSMVCLEPGNVVEKVELPGGGVWVGRQTLSYASL